MPPGRWRSNRWAVPLLDGEKVIDGFLEAALEQMLVAMERDQDGAGGGWGGRFLYASFPGK